MPRQLTLFDAEPCRDDVLDQVRQMIGKTKVANLAWWCANGNRSMCAAYLVRQAKLQPAAASLAVERLAETC
jgi:hypothetical protein